MERCGNGAVMGSELLWNGEETVSSDNVTKTKVLLKWEFKIFRFHKVAPNCTEY